MANMISRTLLVCFLSSFFLRLIYYKSAEASQPYRTGYHFQPRRNWINDPNGPMIYNGLYHIFYQYNPEGTAWSSSILWAHSTSEDLVNWIPHEPAIYSSQPFDVNGCWSGSVTVLPGGKPVILYTGVDLQRRQVQNIALPKNLSDPFLREWVKIPENPIISSNLLDKINTSSFRDPTTAWLGPDGSWRVIIGSKRNQRGLAILYRSRDFLHWIKAKHPLHSVEKTGMWECPDFFSVSKNSTIGLDTSTIGPHVKHVLKVSLDDTKKEYYTVGRYNLAKDKYVPDKGSVVSDSGLRYDYGKFYASKTFFDSQKKRRILWGWVNESSSQTADVNKGWSGLQAIPRTLLLDKTGKQLVQWPIVELQKLRINQVKLPNTVLEGGSVHQVLGVTAAQADIEVSFETSDFHTAEVMDPSWTDPQILCSKKGATVKGGLGPFGLLVLASKGLEEYTAIFYRIFKAHNSSNKHLVLMCSDQSWSSLNMEKKLDKTSYGVFLNVNPEKISLRCLIDHSIVESFGAQGRASITARVYPLLAVHSDAQLFVFNYGTQTVRFAGTAWSLKRAKIN